MINGVFNNPAFRMESLTDSINQIPYVPTMARSLGIFQNEGIATTSIDLEFDAINVMIIPSTQRGAPEPNYRTGKRSMRNLKVPHYPLNDTILPDAIQDVREFGSTDQLQSAVSVVNRRMQGITLSHDATLEYQSIGALKGIIYDSDGTKVLYNLFDEFGVAQDSVDFTFGDANANIQQKCTQILRLIEAGLQVGVAGVRVQCFAGNRWFDAFVAHPQVRDAYQRWMDAGGQQGAFLRDDNRRGFEFGGIRFVNYTGNVGGVNYIQPEEAHFFPVGFPGLFRTVFAPANTMATVNTIGLPRYAWSEPIKGGRGLELYTESNPLCYCTRPKALVKGTSVGSWPTGV